MTQSTQQQQTTEQAEWQRLDCYVQWRQELREEWEKVKEAAARYKSKVKKFRNWATMNLKPEQRKLNNNRIYIYEDVV